MLRLFVGIVVVLAAPVAQAEPDTIGLYTFDADKALEIYGQPVATEIAKDLKQGGIEVIVLAASDKLPNHVRLVVGGSITASGGGFVLAATVRDRVTGETPDHVSIPAVSLGKLETAAAELAGRLLPTIKARLETLRKQDVRQPTPPPPGNEPPKPKLAVVSVTAAGGSELETLRVVLGDAVLAWTKRHGREPHPVDAKALTRELAVKTVTGSETDLGVLLEIVAFSIDAGEVPQAHARVHVRIVDATAVIFDRVVVTDTIVGERNMTREALAVRTAREVLAIVSPAIHRKVNGWRTGY